jgi:hypothetical protein
MKHLITAGCSFTSHSRVNLQRQEQDFLDEHKQFWYYTHWLKTLKPELDVYNMGSPGSGNLLITRSAIYKAKQLLNSGVNGNDISIIVEWSNFHRKSYFVSNEIKEKAPISTHEDYANDFINEKEYPGQKGYWLTMACPDMDKSSFVKLNPQMYEFNQNYLNTLYNDEERFIEWLEYFDYLITFCELNGIKLKSFFMHNPFSSAYKYGMLPYHYRDGNEMLKGLFIDKHIHNTWNEPSDEITKRFPWAEHLYREIDWKKYCWFFEEENLHKNGGVLEWAIRNQLPSTDENFNPLYQEYFQYGSQTATEQAIIDGYASAWGHVGSENYKKFTEDVILKWDMFNE